MCRSPAGTLSQRSSFWHAGAAAPPTTQVPAGAVGAQGAGRLSVSRQLGRKSVAVWGQVQVGALPPSARHSPAPGAQMAGGVGTGSSWTGVTLSTVTRPPLVSHTVAALAGSCRVLVEKVSSAAAPTAGSSIRSMAPGGGWRVEAGTQQHVSQEGHRGSSYMAASAGLQAWHTGHLNPQGKGRGQARGEGRQAGHGALAVMHC